MHMMCSSVTKEALYMVYTYICLSTGFNASMLTLLHALKMHSSVVTKRGPILAIYLDRWEKE